MSRTTSRTSLSTSTKAFVVISPPTMTMPRVTKVSQATRPVGSSARTESRTPSEIWSQTLSGCPSVTDSDVKKNFPLRSIVLLDVDGDWRVYQFLDALDLSGLDPPY